MSCGCKPKMTHPIVSGILMGGVIYLGDLLLRPQFAAGAGMEVILFMIEGLFCDVAYGVINGGSLAGFLHEVSLKKSISAGLTIWVTDFFLRPQNFSGMGMEFIKFALQGFIVMMVLGYSK
jgi:hypothetical protein